MRILIVIVLMLLTALAHGQTHTMPGSNVVPSGASLTIQSGGTITAAGGSTVTGFGSGAVSSVFTRTGAVVAATNDYTFAQIGSKPTTLSGYGITDAQPIDADLTTWAGLTPSANFQTMVPHTFSQMRTDLGLVIGTDVAPVASPTFTGKLTTAASTTGSAGFMLPTGTAPTTPVQGDMWLTGTQLFYRGSAVTSTVATTSANQSWTGTNNFTGAKSTFFTPTTAGASINLPHGVAPSAPANGDIWTTTTGIYAQVNSGTIGPLGTQAVNSSVSAQSPSTSDVYLAGSNVVVAAGDFRAKGQYKCVFDMTKSAGTGAIVITLRAGTAGTTSDAAIQTYTFGAGTSVADLGIFEVIATWRTVGSGTSAVIQGICRGTHQLATTGLFNNAAGWVVIGSPSPSSGFNSTTFTNIGVSFNGSTAFAGTTQVVQAQLQQ